MANLIRLLELPADVKQMVQQGDISQGHARALLPLGDEQEQIRFAARIEMEGCRSARPSRRCRIASIRWTATACGSSTRRAIPAPSPKPRSEQIASLEQELRTALGTKVDLSQTAKGRGKITIHFKNHDEFARLRQLLNSGSMPMQQIRLSCPHVPRQQLFPP